MTQQQVDEYQARVWRRRNQPEADAIADAVKSESDLHDQIIDFCRRRGWIYFHGSMAERTHRTLGEPDFIILASMGRVFFIECKSKNGKPSPAQQAMAAHAKNLGHWISEVRSFQQFLEIIK
jgi:hypothetical protein